ncbi:hypothetical protein GCM10009676_07250 [Prauserella halophila]|uniref:Integral membrane protein n=1 Tax=Prauserella halophila TaxID=185641 RepID=A0ABN1VYY5_9PSEU|nr:hypothetical protein [Prauserella halophila]MCP2237223.1 hypothetical protein [Prauserella halophila]
MTFLALGVALAVLIGLAVMQLLFIGGRQVGEYVWGGQHRVATPRLRRAAVVAIVLYAEFALLLLSRAGVLPGGDTTAITAATWVLLAYCASSIALSAVSRSRRERIVQTPVSILLALGALVVAINGTGA